MDKNSLLLSLGRRIHPYLNDSRVRHVMDSANGTEQWWPIPAEVLEAEEQVANWRQERYEEQNWKFCSREQGRVLCSSKKERPVWGIPGAEFKRNQELELRKNVMYGKYQYFELKLRSLTRNSAIKGHHPLRELNGVMWSWWWKNRENWI